MFVKQVLNYNVKTKIELNLNCFVVSVEYDFRPVSEPSAGLLSCSGPSCSILSPPSDMHVLTSMEFKLQLKVVCTALKVRRVLKTPNLGTFE